MNNWRLLLLAVIAVLQPIQSFTELSLIDGRQECCDHRSNSITQETRLHGTYRKTKPEERRLNSRENIREERRYEARNDPITRSRERLTLERAERQISPESAVRFSAESRVVKDQEFRQTRQEQGRRTRENVPRDSLGRERNVLDSRRIKMSRDDTRLEQIDNERMQREFRDTRDVRRVRDSEDLHRFSTNRETIAVLRRERDNIARDSVRRDSRISTLLDNRERRSLDRRTRDDNSEENKRSRSLEFRLNERNELRSRIASDSRSNFRDDSERIDERRREQNRISRDRTGTVLRDSYERISAAHRRESRHTAERVNRSKKDTKEIYSNDRFDERRQSRDESRSFQERLTILRERRIAAEQRHQTRILDATRDTLQERSRDSSVERQQDSRSSQMLEATARDERLVRSDKRRDDRRQPLTRSLDRVRSSRVSEDLMGREYNSRNAASFTERNVLDRDTRHRRDVRSMERLGERRAQRDENRISRDRTIDTLRETRESSEKRRDTRMTEGRFEVNSRSEREFRIKDLRDNVRFDVNRREREDSRAIRGQNLHRASSNSERESNNLSRTSRFTERASSHERTSKIGEDIRGERSDIQQKIREVDQAPSDRNVATQRRYDTHRISRNTEANARLQSTRSLKDSMNERREARERDESKASRDRMSVTRLFRETRAGNQKREMFRVLQVDARNEVPRNRANIRMGLRSEVRLQDESRSTERVTSRNTETRSERLSRTRDDRRTNEREVRRHIQVFRTAESHRESRMVERNIQPNRHNLGMERRANQHMRIATKQPRSSDLIAKEVRTDTRRDAVDARFRSIEAKIREIEPTDDTSENQNAMTWQIVLYTLQGAYLCGFLMQVLNEKSNKGKSRNLTGWLWAASSKNFVKVD